MAKKGGRISEAQLELEQQLETMSVGPIEVIDRPLPPIDFDDREAAIWSSIVNSMPADWFNIGSVPLLTQYVRHVVASQNLAFLIANATANSEEINVKEYIALLRAQKEESNALSSLATKLRISNQSLINKRGNHKEISGKKKPWES
jgi:hypothetical protein